MLRQEIDDSNGYIEIAEKLREITESLGESKEEIKRRRKLKKEEETRREEAKAIEHPERKQKEDKRIFEFVPKFKEEIRKQKLFFNHKDYTWAVNNLLDLKRIVPAHHYRVKSHINQRKKNHKEDIFKLKETVENIGKNLEKMKKHFNWKIDDEDDEL